VISQLLAGLRYHLLITALGQVVIFYEITGFLRGDFLPIISINPHSVDICFSGIL